MAAKPNSPSPFDTQSAAVEVGCSVRTLENYVRRGDLTPERTPSGRLVFFDEHIRRARELYARNRHRR
jgi:DNA-binding transcriptional MerR regulator